MVVIRFGRWQPLVGNVSASRVITGMMYLIFRGLLILFMHADYWSRVRFCQECLTRSLLVPAYYPETDYIVATRGDGYAFIYFPTGWTAEIRLDRIGAKMINAYWFDPRTGEAKAPENIPGTGSRKFTPPTNGRGNDWILVLDDASKKFKSPGL